VEALRDSASLLAFDKEISAKDIVLPDVTRAFDMGLKSVLPVTELASPLTLLHTSSWSSGDGDLATDDDDWAFDVLWSKVGRGGTK